MGKETLKAKEKKTLQEKELQQAEGREI